MSHNGLNPVPPEDIEESHTWREWFFTLFERMQSTEHDLDPSAVPLPGTGVSHRHTGNYPADVIVTGAGVTAISFSRDDSTYYDVGFTEGIVTLSPYDYIKVDYTGTPVMTKVPR